MALSPVLADALALARDQWWARGAVLMGAVSVWQMLRSREQTPPARIGFGLVVLGVGAALFATAGGMTRLGRPAVPIAVLGMALALGRPDPRAAALAFFAVALPKQGLDVLPGLHSLVSALGLDAGFEAADGGWPLAWLFAGLGAHAALLRGEAFGGMARSAARHALLAVPVQLLALVVAGLMGGGAGRFLLSHGVWSVGAAILLLRAQRTRS